MRVRDVPRRAVGCAAILGFNGDLWVTAGSGLPVRAELPGPVRDAVFGDDRSGVAWLNDLRVEVTTDGGLTRSMPGLAGEFARGLYLGSSGVTVQTTGGHLVLGVDGRLHHRADAGRPEVRQPESGALRNQLNATGIRISAVYVSPTGAMSLGGPHEWPHEPIAAASIAGWSTYQCRYGGDAEATYRSVGVTGSVRWLGWAVTPRGRLTTRSGAATALAWVRAGGQVVPIPEPMLDEADDDRVSVGQVFALPDGGVVFVVSSGLRRLSDFRDAGVALDVGPDGRVRGRRPFKWGRGEAVVAIARQGRCAGPVVGAQYPGVVRMLPIADAARACTRTGPIELPSLDGSTLRPCRRPTSEDAIVIATHEQFVSLLADLAAQHSPDDTLFSLVTRAGVESSGTGHCLRDVTIVAPDNAPNREITLTARGDGLEGSVDLDVVGAPTAWRRVRCEPLHAR